MTKIDFDIFILINGRLWHMIRIKIAELLGKHKMSQEMCIRDRAYNVKQIIYFVTPNWDFTYYLFGGTPLFKELTVPFSLIVCLVYFLIMVVVSCIVFKKRDLSLIHIFLGNLVFFIDKSNVSGVLNFF